MAWIDSIEVSGLAGQNRSHEFELNRDVNVFWGTNGSGKTSLLKILHSALNGEASTILRVPVKKATVSFVAAGTKKRYVRTLEVSPNVKERNEFFHDMLSETSPEEYDRLRYELMRGEGAIYRWRISPRVDKRQGAVFAHQYLPISRVPAGRVSRARVHSGQDKFDVLDEASYDRMFASGIQDLWRDYSTDELVNIREIQTRGIAEILKRIVERQTDAGSEFGEIPADEAFDYVNMFFDSQKLTIKATHPGQFVDDFHNNPVLRQVVTEIVAIQKSIEKAQEPARKIEALLQDLFAGGKRVDLRPGRLSVRTQDGGIPIASLSSGEKQIIRLLLECLAAGNNSIIIDEPELSMHVDWQHRLIESLRLVNPNAQIIVATHSPEVMARLDDDKVFQL